MPADPYIQSQIDARRRPAVIKIRFLDYRSRYPLGNIVAVEGDDDKVVYSQWISRCCPGIAYEFFVCDGKRGARQLSNSLYIDRGQASKDVIFLVDRDFHDLDGFKSTDRVFMLDRYSIENYLVCKKVINAAVKAAYPDSSRPDVRDAVCAIFQSDYQNFLTVSSELNMRIYIARHIGVDIDNLMPNSMSDIARVALQNVLPSAKAPEDVLPLSLNIGDAEFRTLCGAFERLEPSKRYRGKFAMKFFRIWLDELAAEYRQSKKGLFPSPRTGSTRIKHEEFSLGSLASKSVIPDGFAEFLNSACTA